MKIFPFYNERIRSMKILKNNLENKLNLRTEENYPVEGVEFIDVTPLIMSKEISMLNVRINNDLKKKLKLIAVYEDTTVSDVVIGFLEYGVKVYNDEQRLINKK